MLVSLAPACKLMQQHLAAAEQLNKLAASAKASQPSPLEKRKREEVIYPDCEHLQPFRCCLLEASGIEHSVACEAAFCLMLLLLLSLLTRYTACLGHHDLAQAQQLMRRNLGLGPVVPDLDCLSCCSGHPAHPAAAAAATWKTPD